MRQRQLSPSRINHSLSV
ncbi:hypothetical protein YPPY01_2173, partial [Yersinia pestis PY-01]